MVNMNNLSEEEKKAIERLKKMIQINNGVIKEARKMETYLQCN